MVLGGVGLIKGRVKDSGPAMVAVATAIRECITPNWFSNQSFDYVQLILRFGDASMPETEFQPVNRRHRELPLARTLSMRDCQQAARDGRLTDLFMQETQVALKDVAMRYQLDTAWIGTLPDHP